MEQDDILKELGMTEADLQMTEQSEPAADVINFDELAMGASSSSVSDNKNAISETVHVEQLKEVKVPVTVELGRIKKSLAELEQMTKGSIIPLGTKVDDPITISCQGKPFAEAEVVDMEGELQLVVTRVLSQG
ncbi:FliM/FliN family flagellar motor C-terminal domain-containing protein [Vibrio sp. D431a]|uniref:FliM/FliN family flagellar motor C-terminal domain-containing protein n=1 Tax=Vibrio sp. D431a TaxID=2837388 RepID=UPI002556943F|nr:FliM/FliN family flagellar motor C-terminal domain-containing protein [Vibrio sp. D431a]MDK9793921.1 FliM/FliN family flagellar motor switch protein [Vibrio sp. D431a]